MKKLCRKETHLFFGSQEEQDKKKKKEAVAFRKWETT